MINVTCKFGQFVVLRVDPNGPLSTPVTWFPGNSMKVESQSADGMSIQLKAVTAGSSLVLVTSVVAGGQLLTDQAAVTIQPANAPSPAPAATALNLGLVSVSDTQVTL